MLKLKLNKILIPEKHCPCGCGKISVNKQWRIHVELSGAIKSVEDCINIIEMLENEMQIINKEAIVCNQCGYCCSHAPEVSFLEVEYLKIKYNIRGEEYNNIKAGLQCPYGGYQLHHCKFDKHLRPLQCRILFCQVDIENFDVLYNPIADFLSWERI